MLCCLTIGNIAPMVAQNIQSGNETLQLSNEQCRQIAKKSDRNLQIADNKIEMSKIDKQVAFSNYLPNLSGNAGMMYPTKDYEIQEGMEMSLKGAYMAGLSLSVPLYAGGKIHAGYNSTKIGMEANKINKEKEVADILYNTDQAYWMFVSVSEKVKLLESYQKQLAQILNQVKISVSAEMGTRNDMLLIESKKSQIDYQLQKANNGKEIARMALCQKIGVSPFTHIIPTDTTVQVSEPILGNLDDNFSNRPELRLLQKQVELKKEGVKIALANYLPTLALSGGYNHFGGIKFAGQKFTSNSTSITAVLQVPIYHFGENYKNVKKAKLDAQNSRLTMEHNQELINIEVQQQKRNMLDAFSLIKTAELSMSQAEEALRITRMNYEVKMKTITDLLEAQSSWQEAYSNVIEAKTNYKIQHAAYLKAVGRLQ